MIGRRLAVGLLALGALGAVGVGFALAPRPAPQPIAFSHQLHVEELGSDCTDCCSSFDSSRARLALSTERE